MKLSAINPRSLLALLLLACVPFSWAATPQSYTIHLSATIPPEPFDIRPVESGWIEQTQEMGFDEATRQLHPFIKTFQYKNGSGGIQASLMQTNASGKATLSNGTEEIPLQVSFNGVSLSQSATTVITAEAAKAGGRADLRITQDEDKALSLSGAFTGQVTLMFEPAAAVRAQ